jgi:hypothetical protein
MFLSPPLSGGSGEAAGINIERYLSRTIRCGTRQQKLTSH